MRMMTKGGFTPSDRRPDRRKVAFAALAVFLISATAASANTVDFVANPALSSLKLTVTTQVTPYNAFWNTLGAGTWSQQVSQPQFAVSAQLPVGLGDTTSYFGHMYADFTPGGVNGNIKLVPGGRLYADTIVNPVTNSVQNFAPGEILTGLPGPNNNAKASLAAPPQPANYALSIPQSPTFLIQNSATQRIYGLEIDAKAGNVATPMDIAGNFSLVGNNLQIKNGISDFVESISAYLDNNTNPTVIFINSQLKATTHQSLAQTGPLDFSSMNMKVTSTGNWDGTTLTLNVHTSLLIQNGQPANPATMGLQLHAIPLLMEFDGTLVFNAYGGFGGPVPEPSTVTLLGFGVAGILTYAYRARKHKALVA